MTKKPLRVLVLVHETLVPPDSTEGYTAQEVDEWRTEYDVTTSLRAMGHEVKVLGMGDNLACRPCGAEEAGAPVDGGASRAENFLLGNGGGLEE